MKRKAHQLLSLRKQRDSYRRFDILRRCQRVDWENMHIGSKRLSGDPKSYDLNIYSIYFPHRLQRMEKGKYIQGIDVQSPYDNIQVFSSPNPFEGSKANKISKRINMPDAFTKTTIINM